MIDEPIYENEEISSWNRSFIKKAKVIYPKNTQELKKIFNFLQKFKKKYLIRTGHCSYDDKSITDNFETYVISLKNFNKIISINKKKGLVSVQAGALFTSIVKRLKNEKCSLYSIPGGSHISIGGAIAANVIGKDSNKKYACFGDTIKSIQILDNNGHIKKINYKAKNFFNYIGSFGLAGMILSADLKIKKLKSHNVKFKSKIINNLNEVKFELEKKTDFKYIQLDPFFRENNFGVVFEANLSSSNKYKYKEQNMNSNFFEKILFRFSSFFINSLTLKIIYKLFFSFSKNKNDLIDISNFHYPSKYIHLVPLLCRGGLVDYEVLIKKDFVKKMKGIIKFLKKHDMFPIYIITKKIYKSNKKFFYQFSDNGYSVAMAFDKNNTNQNTFISLEKLFHKYDLKTNLCKNKKKLFLSYKKDNDLFMSEFKKRIINKLNN